MSKEKQIEEMAKDLQKSEHWYFNDHSVDFELDRFKTAENLYNAGYRKQSEGEWVVCGMFDDFFKCSSCGDKHPWQTAIEYKYCPNCGAKMKGGAE